MKLHKSNGSNNSFVLAQKTCPRELSALSLRLYACIKYCNKTIQSQSSKQFFSN